MGSFSCFDIIGPIMVGPSSSHTAGAVRLGQLARVVLGEEPRKVQLLLHGSFAQTYQGHGTYQALVAGLLGIEVDDEENISKSLEIAKERNMDVRKDEVDLGEDYHENSVRFVLSGDKRSVQVVGSSIGGGNIKLTDIDEYKNLEITGEYETLFVVHNNKPGVIHNLCGIIRPEDINIAYLASFTENDEGYTVIYVNKHIEEDTLTGIRRWTDTHKAILISPIKK